MDPHHDSYDSVLLLSGLEGNCCGSGGSFEGADLRADDQGLCFFSVGPKTPWNLLHCRYNHQLFLFLAAYFEISFINHNTHHFKLYISVVLMHSEMCKYHCYNFRIFPSLPHKTSHPKVFTPTSPDSH